jgi:hypothetical protein
MPIYNTKPGKRKNVVAKVDTRQGDSDKIIKAGHSGYALALRIEDQKVLIKWAGIAGRGSSHSVNDIEFL